MKNFLFISTLLAAGTLSAFAEDLTLNATTNSASVLTSQNTKLSYDNVSVESGVAGTITISANNSNLHIGSLSIADASSSLKITEATCDLILIDNLSGAGTLTIAKAATNQWGGGVILGATDSTTTTTSGSFSGTINIWNGSSDTTGSNYSQVLFVQNESIASAATIALGSHATLAVSTDTVKIAGLSGTATDSAVISYAISSNYTYDNTTNSTNIYNNTTAYSSNDATVRTLELTGSGTYEYAGNIGSLTNGASSNPVSTASSLNLTLSGTGTQNLSGTNYIGVLTINSGSTLNLTGGTTTITASSGSTSSDSVTAVTNSGTLSIGEDATLALNLTPHSNGSSSVSATLNATGTGTIVVTNSSSSHSAKVSVGTDFAGTVSWTGNLNPANLTNLSASATLVLASYSTSTYMWSGSSQSIAAKTILDGTYRIGTSNTFTFSNGLEGKNSGAVEFYTTGTGVAVAGTLKDVAIVSATGAGTNTFKISGDTTLTGTVNLTQATSVTTSIESGATLTIAGTLALANTITNSGTVVVSADSFFDLASSMASTSGDTTTYTIFSGGTITDWSTLLANKTNFTIDGEAISARQEISSSSDAGTLVITGAAFNLYWTADSGTWETASVWAKDSVDSGTAETFERGDNVFFTQSASVTVGTAGTHANSMTISGTAVELTGIANLSWASAEIGEGATLKIADVLSNNTTIEHLTGAGTLQVTMNGDSGSWGHNLILSNSTFAGTVEVLGGHYTIASSTNTSDIASAKYLFNGASVEAANTATISNGVEFAADANFHSNQNITLTISGDFAIDSSATVTKKGAGAISITGNAEISGTLAIDAGTVSFTPGANKTLTVAENATVTAASLTFSNSGASAIFKAGSTTTFTGDIVTANGGASSGGMTIESGATVTAANFLNEWGMGGALTVDGVLDVSSGTFKMSTGSGTNTVTGTGTIKAQGLLLGNVGTYDLSGVRFEIGTGGISLSSSWGYAVNLGALTMATSETWTSDAVSLTLAATGSDATVFEIGEDGNVTIGNAVAGTGNLTKTGAGTLALTGANTYSGTTTVSAGTLKIQNATANSYAGGINVTGGTLELAGTNTIAGTIDVSGGTFELSGTVSVSGACTVVNVTGTTTLSNVLTITGTQESGSNTSLYVKEGGTVVFTETGGIVQSGSSHVEIQNGGTLEIQATTQDREVSTLNEVQMASGSTLKATGSHTVKITQAPQGTVLALVGINLEAGAGATLEYENSSFAFGVYTGSKITGEGTFKVGASSSVSLSGVTVDIAKVIADATGTLTISAGTTKVTSDMSSFAGTVNLSAGTSVLEISSTIGSSDTKAAGVTLASGAKLLLTNDWFSGTSGISEVSDSDAIALIVICSEAITLAGTTIDSSNASLFESYVEYGSDFDAFNKAWSYNDGSLILTLTAIPEPSSFGLLAGTLALGLAGTRRRRKRS